MTSRSDTYVISRSTTTGSVSAEDDPRMESFHNAAMALLSGTVTTVEYTTPNAWHGLRFQLTFTPIVVGPINPDQLAAMIAEEYAQWIKQPRPHIVCFYPSTQAHYPLTGTDGPR